MYAIVRCGGKQYRVEAGKYLDVEKLNIEEGQSFEIEEVLFIRNGETISVGQPTVNGAKVKATVMKQWRDKKVIVYKYRQRTNYRKKMGHRHIYTRIMIDEIIV